MKPILRLLWVSVLLLAACNEGSPSPGVTTLPDEGDPCEDLGQVSCGNAGGGGEAVLVCHLDDQDELHWMTSEVCDYKCQEQHCVAPGPDTIGPDAGQDVSGTDAQEPDAADTQQPDICQPACEGMECGPDGCGGACGACNGAEVCLDGKCCEPACDGKACGDDGCGGSCGDCPEGDSCTEAGSCCTPDCLGKLCGDDGCGGSCGECGEDEVCNAKHQCAPPCQPKCEGKECGGDGCGGSCGDCEEGWACGAGGLCNVCVPDCGDKVCGDNGCGGICGSCAFGEDCVDGACKEVCFPDCATKQCGDDGCSGSCGDCDLGQDCLEGMCVFVCEPQCADKECGPDGCGGICGKCPEYAVCTTEGTCDADCIPQCLEKECGDDGCNGSCGTCAVGLVCNPYGLCQDPQDGCGGVGPQGACDGTFLLTCDSGVQLIITDCLQVGKNATCAWLEGLNGYGCLESGECIPDCTGKQCGTDGCGGSCGTCGLGQTCNDEGMCEGDGACGQITYQGCCSGNTVVSCVQNQLAYMNCSNQVDPDKQSCGWNADQGFYDCVTEPLQGPGLDYYCPGGCIPNCAGKQCGDDGCGGSCGDCPFGLVCEDNVCVVEGGGCGPYEAEPICQVDTVIWCDDSSVSFIDCAALGPFYYCGWNPDLFVYSCLEEECIPDCDGKECGADGCGYVCGYCPVTKMCNDNFQCIYGQGKCGDVTYEGQCNGDIVEWCQNGILQTFDCMNLGPAYHCGWFDDGGYYWCVL